jgi:long-chain acyl-CoA synthetase
MFRTEKPWLRVYEGYAPPETEIHEGSLGDFFRYSLEEHRDKVALTFYGTTLGFDRLTSCPKAPSANP